MSTTLWWQWLAGTLAPLAALWLLFWWALRPERCFGYNRALLLLAPVVAAAWPLLPHPELPWSWVWASSPLAATEPLAGPLPLPGGPTASPAAGAAVGEEVPWFLLLYLGGVAVGLGRLVWRVGQLHQLAQRLPRVACAGYVLVRTGGQLPTSSFGRTVFWDETVALTPGEVSAVLTHEVAHVHQRHTLDCLWLEAWRVLLWPNPFVHLLLPALRLTHELLADRTASTPGYPALLARLAARHLATPQYDGLLQPFTFSFTLTRIAMLKTQIPVRRWKQWLVVPVLGALSLASAHPARAQEGQAQVTPVPDEATQKAHLALIKRKLREAVHQDSLRTGGKMEPGMVQQFNITYMDGPGEPVVTITRMKAPLVPPMPPGRKVYTYVEQMPHLPGASGNGPIVSAIQSRLAYPKVSRRQRQEGQVFVRFIVAADGTVRDAEMVKGLSPAYDQAVLQAVQQLPTFEPGRQDGKAVDVSFTLPVQIKAPSRR